MAATKEQVAEKAAAPVRQPDVVRPTPETALARPVFSTEPRSNGVPASARAAELTGGSGGTATRARMASSLQRTLGNARMARMMAHGGPAGRAASTTAVGKIPSPTQEKLELTFGAPLDFIDVHTGAAAEDANRRMGSRAFAHGQDIYLGPGETAHDTALMGHEVAHVFQQRGGGAQVQRSAREKDTAYEREADRASAAALRSEPVTIHESTSGHRPQFWGLGQALDFLADKANVLPGYRMFTIVLGVNPINMAPAERSAGNILRAVIEFIPGGGLITQVADAYGAFDKVATWVEPQITAVAGAAAAIKSAITEFLGTLKFSDIFDPSGVWERAKSIFTTPVNRVINVAKGLLNGILALFRDIILMPLVGLAEKTRGWDLLIAVLGKNPITGAPVPRTAETLVPGFLKLIGEEETWNNIKKANALARCWAWFQGAMGTVMGFVQQVPTLLVNALKSLVLEDILLLPRAFAKVAVAFGNFIGSFITWAGEALWTLLQIIFEVLAPAAIPYLKKVGAAFKKILKNPMEFVGNLVKAGKQGFMQFADNVGAHLKTSLIEWLTGSLPGVYIPKSFDFKEIVKFALSVLGLSWANIRVKLVKVVGEPAVKAMEVGFEIVKTLVTEGPAAAWEKIKELLANLKDMVIQGIMDFVIETVVKKAVAKIIAWLIPGAGFIDAIISIYDAILVFIDKLKKIIQVATAFLDSIVNIANGVIGAAANKVESTLAGLLTLAINFLAGFVGLGRVADKVMEIINTKVRAPVDKALDFVINWIVTTAKKLFAKVFGKKEEKATPEEQKWNDAVAGVKADLAVMEEKGTTDKELNDAIPGWISKYGFKSLTVVSKEDEWEVDGSMSPGKTVGKVEAPGTKKNPFKLDWPKPASSQYPVLYFGGKLDHVKKQPDLEALEGKVDETGTKVKAYSPHSGGTLPGGEKIGITPENRVSVGKVVGPLSEDKTPGGGTLNDVLKKYGFSPQTEGLDADHVREIQMGGENVLGNLWPLDKGINRGAGSTLKSASVEYPKSTKSVKLSELKQKARQYFFKIKETHK